MVHLQNVLGASRSVICPLESARVRKQDVDLGMRH